MLPLPWAPAAPISLASQCNGDPPSPKGSAEWAAALSRSQTPLNCVQQGVHQGMLRDSKAPLAPHPFSHPPRRSRGEACTLGPQPCFPLGWGLMEVLFSQRWFLQGLSELVGLRPSQGCVCGRTACLPAGRVSRGQKWLGWEPGPRAQRPSTGTIQGGGPRTRGLTSCLGRDGVSVSSLPPPPGFLEAPGMASCEVGFLQNRPGTWPVRAALAEGECAPRASPSLPPSLGLSPSGAGKPPQGLQIRGGAAGTQLGGRQGGSQPPGWEVQEVSKGAGEGQTLLLC